jgi:hypothetical protein
VNKFLLVFILLFNSNLLAKTQYPRVSQFSNGKGQFSLNYSEGDLQGLLTWNRALIIDYKKSEATEPLSQFQVIEGQKKTYVLISFQKGVHGESFDIWQFPEGIKLFSFKSIWPIKLTIENQSFSISYFDSLQNDFKGKELTFKHPIF